MTEPVLALVHTIPANIETFDALIGELAPDIPIRHVMHEDLLKEALAAGEVTADIRRRTAEAIIKEAENGAAVVLCTCSTVGPGADDAAELTATKVMRVDRPMAEAAVRGGTRIGVAATLSTTLGPTLDLLSEAAARAGKEIDLRPVVFEEARAKLMEGDTEGYLTIIAEGLRRAATDSDVIVLAQASMAPALARCQDIEVPILTSPRSGLEAAVQAYKSICPS
ncbi:MAG: aspartate/glutamate racemase family protein [Proteobacteria bacterium]|nr:aspartate/glutamate racemase family protein [Pseudomonadota bacterium]MDA1357884.1 aspartate/glutamate racemase family protein [Pseudomonadota bacterium]